MKRRRLLRALLAYLTVQVLAVAAGLSAAALLDSSVAGLAISNVGAVAGVLFALRIFFGSPPDRRGSSRRSR